MNDEEHGMLKELTAKLNKTASAIFRELLRKLHKKELQNLSKIIFVIALCLSAAACGGQPSPITDAPPIGGAPKTVTVVRYGVVFVGDSLFGRWNLDSYFPGKGYINAGWFGKRTDEILAALPSILDGSKVCHGYDGTPSDPDFPFTCQSITPPAEIVILAGWNDLFQGKDPQQAADNISAMVALANANGVKVVICIPYRYDSAFPMAWMGTWQPCDTVYPYSAQLPTLISGTEAAGIVYKAPMANLEWLFLTHAGCQSNYTIDGIHPNASGYQQMHDFLVQII
jgi:hypothetical protein